MSDRARSNGRGLPAALLASAALWLPACAGVGPNFERPPAPGVKGYLPPEASQKEEEVGREAAAQRIALGQSISGQWWDLFHSPRLDGAVHQAIAANGTLAAAKANLRQALQVIAESRAGFYPQLDLEAGAHRGTQANGAVANVFSVGPSLSFTIDAFGEARRRVEQATALAESQRYELAAAYLAVTGNLVAQAVAIATARAQIAAVEDVIKNDQKNLDLVQRSFDAGKVAKADVLTAAAQLAADRTQLPPLYQERSVARHALAVLSGRATGGDPPPDFEILEFLLPNDLPVSLPSELVRQRPDILSAEALLHADSAAIGVATAAMFPSITLSASLTQNAATLASLFKAASTAWSTGADLDAPLFRGGALAAQRRAAIDAYQAALATYQQTVLQAFGQVADALSALQHDAEAVAVSERAMEVANASLALQRSSFAAGKTTALQLIAAENTYSNSLLGGARARGQQFSDTALLLVAVGGGWWNDKDLAGAAQIP